MPEYELNTNLFEPLGLLHQLNSSNMLAAMQLYKNQMHSVGVPLTELMLDRRRDEGIARNDKPIADRFYYENCYAPEKSSALYLIRCKTANRDIIKVGKAKQLLKRLAGYKTALPHEGEIIVIASLIIEGHGLVCALEKLVLSHINMWSAQPGSEIKRLRRTEWLFKNKKDIGIAICALCFVNIASFKINKQPY